MGGSVDVRVRSYRRLLASFIQQWLWMMDNRCNHNIVMPKSKCRILSESLNRVNHLGMKHCADHASGQNCRNCRQHQLKILRDVIICCIFSWKLYIRIWWNSQFDQCTNNYYSNVAYTYPCLPPIELVSCNIPGHSLLAARIIWCFPIAYRITKCPVIKWRKMMDGSLCMNQKHAWQCCYCVDIVIHVLFVIHFLLLFIFLGWVLLPK